MNSAIISGTKIKWTKKCFAEEYKGRDFKYNNIKEEIFISSHENKAKAIITFLLKFWWIQNSLATILVSTEELMILFNLPWIVSVH